MAAQLTNAPDARPFAGPGGRAASNSATLRVAPPARKGRAPVIGRPLGGQKLIRVCVTRTGTA